MNVRNAELVLGGITRGRMVPTKVRTIIYATPFLGGYCFVDV